VKFIFGLAFFTTVVSSTCLSAEVSLHDYRGGGWVEVSGEIAIGDTEKVSAALSRANWEYVAIYFNSPGGVATEGIKLGLLANKMGYATVVGNRMCASACALAWTGGTIRLMMPDARVGYHTTYIMDVSGKFVRSEEGNSAVHAYALSIGLSEDAAQMMTRADPDDIVWLTPALGAAIGIKYDQLVPGTDVIPYSQQ
jgi:hypothetical protein